MRKTSVYWNSYVIICLFKKWTELEVDHALVSIAEVNVWIYTSIFPFPTYTLFRYTNDHIVFYLTKVPAAHFL